MKCKTCNRILVSQKDSYGRIEYIGCIHCEEETARLNRKCEEDCMFYIGKKRLFCIFYNKEHQPAPKCKFFSY